MIVLYQPFQTRTIPCFAPPHLPPLSKGGGLTARHKLSLCCIFTCDTSTFLIYQTFSRQDGGIAIPPFAQHHIYASLVKDEVLSPERIRATTGRIATPLSLACTNPSKNRTIPLAFRRGRACPSRCTEYYHPHNHCKRTIIPRPALSLALHHILAI